MLLLSLSSVSSTNIMGNRPMLKEEVALHGDQERTLHAQGERKKDLNPDRHARLRFWYPPERDSSRFIDHPPPSSSFVLAYRRRGKAFNIVVISPDGSTPTIIQLYTIENSPPKSTVARNHFET
jgi:hypothetical protein